MPSSAMYRRVALLCIHASEERIASVIMVIRTGELGVLAVTSNQNMLRRNLYLCKI
jgi:hypothetical protein